MNNICATTNSNNIIGGVSPAEGMWMNDNYYYFSPCFGDPKMGFQEVLYKVKK
jgi:hypothetical protein